MFTRPRVSAVLEKFVLAKLFVDSGKYRQENLSLIKERFKLEPALPRYLVLKSTGEVLAVTGYEPDEEAFLAFLNKGL